eukprot:322118-Pelagomonas_calceolata.AAC.3
MSSALGRLVFPTVGWGGGSGGVAAKEASKTANRQGHGACCSHAPTVGETEVRAGPLCLEPKKRMAAPVSLANSTGQACKQSMRASH